MMWWQALEGKGESEKFPNAFKLQVSKYDCLTFDDGTPGLYTEEGIAEEIAAAEAAEAAVENPIP